MDATIGIVIVVSLVALAGGVFVWLRSRTPKEEPILHFRCPGCSRRLRFRARQAGNAGRCSHCGRDLKFPPASQSID